MNFPRIPIFEDVSVAAVADILHGAHIIRLSAGERLLQAGQDNHHLYILLAGRMEARLTENAAHQGIPIAVGEAIGEMSILDGQKASAHVFALDVCQLLAIGEEDFWSRLAPLPGVLRNMTRQVIQRMRAASERMVRGMEEELKYAHLKKELAVARDIQMGLLPHRTPLLPNHAEVDASAFLLPAKEVGGDLYDAFAIDDEHILLAVGDVSGKGMAAAMFMMRTLTLLRAEAGLGLPGESLLPTLNTLLCEGNDADMFVTLCILVLSARSGRLTVHNGGHPPPVISRSGQPFRTITGTKGALLGMLPNARFQTQALQLSPGDRVVLYSDGVTEAENMEGEMYRESGMLTTLDGCPTEMTMNELVSRLNHGVKDFAAGAEQSDDISILAARYLGG